MCNSGRQYCKKNKTKEDHLLLVCRLIIGDSCTTSRPTTICLNSSSCEAACQIIRDGCISHVTHDQRSVGTLSGVDGRENNHLREYSLAGQESLITWQKCVAWKGRGEYFIIIIIIQKNCQTHKVFPLSVFVYSLMCTSLSFLLSQTSIALIFLFVSLPVCLSVFLCLSLFSQILFLSLSLLLFLSLSLSLFLSLFLFLQFYNLHFSFSFVFL